ncbi:winged helix-turn-helix domain-containing protein [Polaribacter tangerinus]|uniref:winged helix-turn-helix domain-containing protein n=1 Tax=Polaribacter tangerinus TaxID=1920034 RepID=UPI000B4B610B|nr:GntR family transcriptional regulator [Polaribacter tangerinus]
MVEVKNEIGVPKYKQIIASIESDITNGVLVKGEKLPSINFIRDSQGVSRDTVLMAYNDLKNRGIIHSIVGKGYYLISENVSVHQKIFLLFDELNAFKEDLYNSFLESLPSNYYVDIYFHHFNSKLFHNLIKEHIGQYNYYIIMPANLKEAAVILKNLPNEKVCILDQLQPNLNAYSAIYQNFEKSIYNCLMSVKNEIEKKYTNLVLVFDDKIQPQGMKEGFLKFCTKAGLTFEVVNNISGRPLKKGELYIIPEDKNLLIIIKKLKNTVFKLKKDIGIISYNDTMLKEIVEGGITTISTDFKKMGKNLASLIHKKEYLQMENPTSLILRNSL